MLFVQEEGTLIHAKTNINMEQYFSHYHDYICQHKHDRALLTPHEINACKKLTIELLRSIEGKSNRLVMPFEDGIEYLINNVDDFYIYLIKIIRHSINCFIAFYSIIINRILIVSIALVCYYRIMSLIF